VSTGIEKQTVGFTLILHPFTNMYVNGKR